MERIRPLPASATRIKHSMEDGPSFPRCRKVLLYSYRVDVTLSLEWFLFFLRELLAGRRAIETGAFKCLVGTLRRALLLLFAHILLFLLHCIHIWVLGGWRQLYYYSPFFLCMLATLAFVTCIVLVTFAGTWLTHCHINEDC